MKSEKKVLVIVVIAIAMILIMSIGFVSANWFTDMFKVKSGGEIKGEEGELAVVSPKTVTLKVEGSAAPPEIVFISDLGYAADPPIDSAADRTLTEDTHVVRNFEYYAYSAGGVTALPGPSCSGCDVVSSSNALLTIKDVLNSPNRERKSSDIPGGVVCSYNRDAAAPTNSLTVPGYAGLMCRVYRCSVPVYYYDDYGSSGAPNWEVRAYVKDAWNQEEGYKADGTTVKNAADLPARRTYFKKLTSIKMDPDGGILDFGNVGYGPSVNKQPSDSAGPTPPKYPLRIRNTGNSDISQTSLTASNIPGVGTPSEFILASWFKTAPTNPCSGTALVAGSAVNTGIPTLNNGPSGSSSESDLRVCLVQVLATASSQSYSTAGGTAWTFGGTFV